MGRSPYIPDNLLLMKGGTLLPANIRKALYGANSPSELNVFATMADISGSLGIYEQNYEFRDFVEDADYDLDIKAKFDYTIAGLVHECDSGSISGVTVTINGTPIPGLTDLTTTSTLSDSVAITGSYVAEGDRVKLMASTVTGSPTLIRGKLYCYVIIYEEGGGEGIINVKTAMSITGSGIPVDPVKLVGDEGTLTSRKYYGSDATGSKGYHSFPVIDKDFEFCVEAGSDETFKLDIYAAYNYTITKAILESDGTLEGVQVKIGSTAVTGLTGMNVSTASMWTATANNEVEEGDAVTLITSSSYSGSPTAIRGKLVISV